MLIITLTKLGNNINAKIVDNSLNLEVNYYEDSSNLTLVYNIKNNTVTLSIKGTTSYTTPNINTNNCLYFVNLTGFGTTLIDDKINFDFFYPSIFPAPLTPTTPNIDEVLAQGGNFNDNRLIDVNGFLFDIVNCYILSIQSNNTLNSIFSINTNQIQFIIDTIGFITEVITGTTRYSKIGDVSGTYNNTTIGADDFNNTIIVTGNSITTATAGGSAGQHLKIKINGTNYKIALLNP